MEWTVFEILTVVWAIFGLRAFWQSEGNKRRIEALEAKLGETTDDPADE
jgi:hypothetical protein